MPESSETAKLKLRDQDLELPVVVGTENETAVDIGSLRRDTGVITLDEGLCQHRVDDERDYIPQRRGRRTALSRLPD